MMNNTTATPSPKRRLLLRSAIALVVLAVAVCAALAWLLGTGGGLRFALARAEAATDGALTVQSAQGQLAGPLDLVGLRYRDGKGIDVRIAKAHLDPRLLTLLRKRVRALDLRADDVEIDLPPSQPASDDHGGFSLVPPFNMVVDRGHVGSLHIRQGGQPLFASDSLDLSGMWTTNGITLRSLKLRAPDGHVTLDGLLVVGATYRGDSTTDFSWRAAGNTWTGQMHTHGDRKQASLDLQLTQPMAAHLSLQVAQSGKYAWSGKLDAPRFDPKPLLGDSNITALSTSLNGQGDRRSATLLGQLGINGYKVDLHPSTARLSDDLTTLTLDPLTIGSPQFKGEASTHGTIQLASTPTHADLQLDWSGVELPASLAGQLLRSTGKLHASGSSDAFHAQGDLTIGPLGKPSNLSVNLDGTPRQLTVHTLTVHQPGGQLQASGELILQPALAWQAQVNASRFDPGAFFSQWPGALDADIATHGVMTNDQPDVQLDLRKLAGQLRGRDLRGNGSLHLVPQQVLDGQMDIASGRSEVRINAKPGTTNDISLHLAIATLADWLPQSEGKLGGDIRVHGSYPALAIDANLQGQALSLDGQRVDQLNLVANVPNIGQPGGKLELQGAGVHAGGLDFSQVNVHGSGTGQQHSLTLDARGTPLSTTLALDGDLTGSAWHGRLSAWNVELQGLPRWHLQQPAALAYDDGAINVGELCLSAGDPLLCVTANQDKAGNLDAGYRLQQLPLALLLDAISTTNRPMRTDGLLSGQGRVHRSAAGALEGEANLSSARGTLAYVDRPDQPLLGYTDLAINAQLTPASQRVDMHAALTGDGHMDGHVTVSGAQQALGGNVSLQLGNLAPLDVFTNALVNPKGTLHANVNLGGTLAQPAIHGQAALEHFSAEIPALGIKPNQGQITLTSTDPRHLQIDGGLHAGEGELRLQGIYALGNDETSTITLRGGNLLVADIPAAKVAVSPNLVLTLDANGLAITGALGVDSANVDISKLPGGGATQASSDVVVVDDPQREQPTARLPISAAVSVNLGKKTQVAGMGLDGQLAGVLVVTERPGQVTTGQGQVQVSGSYKAYGQNLQIERGQLLFASTPIDNPGLNIRAGRKLNPNATIDDGQRVGLDITGTAKHPVLTVFSQPAMEQSDALAYLITGKPLSQVNSGESSMVNTAAQALGSAAGNLLAKTVGSRLGFADIGISSNDALGGSSAFTIGKYLSPRLYLSYGIGLFDPGQVVTLRYHLSSRWNVEAQSATDFERASFNYRYER